MRVRCTLYSLCASYNGDVYLAIEWVVEHKFGFCDQFYNHMKGRRLLWILIKILIHVQIIKCNSNDSNVIRTDFWLTSKQTFDYKVLWCLGRGLRKKKEYAMSQTVHQLKTRYATREMKRWKFFSHHKHVIITFHKNMVVPHCDDALEHFYVAIKSSHFSRHPSRTIWHMITHGSCDFRYKTIMLLWAWVHAHMPSIYLVHLCIRSTSVLCLTSIPMTMKLNLCEKAVCPPSILQFSLDFIVIQGHL